MGAGTFPYRGGGWGVRLRERVRLKRRRGDQDMADVAAAHTATRRAGAWQDLSNEGKLLTAQALTAVLPLGLNVPASIASSNLLAGATLGVTITEEERAKRVLELERVRVAPRVPARRRPPPPPPQWRVDATVGADAAGYLWRKKDWEGLGLLMVPSSVSALKEMANRWTAGGWPVPSVAPWGWEPGAAAAIADALGRVAIAAAAYTSLETLAAEACWMELKLVAELGGSDRWCARRCLT